MARQKTNLIIGLFVILGVVMGVVAIIWVGATSYFQKGATYVSYFDESVQGLQLNSAVKFRGVDWDWWKVSGWPPTTATLAWS